jgi:cell division protein ZapA (FtsZ GTPase activity inhibitor)
VSQKRTVPVIIQGRQYRIRADGESAGVERAAVLLDETMTKVRARSGTADSVDIAVLAALNLANALATDRASESSGRDLEERIETLVRLIESATAEPGAAAS